MPKPKASIPVESQTADQLAISSFSERQTPEFRAICDQLRELINSALPNATSKVWHGGPVWFIGENPVVGYDVSAKAVKLLFWNGKTFDEPTFKPVGKARAAQAVFTTSAELNPERITHWLEKARTDVFDSVGFFKQQRQAK